ncbi:unnamed protein product [Polarella glacialis]|uniref:Uncharacterized protein n=1 Tax=Polarella glacialis TaxID=89957 RepID=A0A813JJ40_POLGL|nr:unnamed protein product [Polarella glacialis]|mmetsp:Transcript_6070/g.9720  ORF Transcript_6070/g.9720 Transcript_6070/m.9720 type:complete len:241 (+) Transcript_6070:61-783(+)
MLSCRAAACPGSRGVVAKLFSPSGLSSRGVNSSGLGLQRFSRWQRVSDLHERRPLLCSMFWGAAKGVSACVLSQVFLEQSGSINTEKVAAFCLWSTFPAGGGTYIAYGKLFPRFMPVITRAGLPHPQQKANIVKMVCLDNFVLAPAFWLPSLYAIQSAVDGGLEVFSSPGVVIDRAWQRYSGEWFEVCSLTWIMWVPLHTVTFSIIPTHFRVAFTSIMSLFTIMGISWQQSRLGMNQTVS